MVRNLWAAHVGDAPSLWYTIHFWSLSVEEHFYLFLPGLLVLVPRGKRLWATGIIAVVAATWAMCIFHFPALQTREVWLRTDYRLAQLMVPAFFAILLAGERSREAVMQWLPPWVAFLLVGVAQLVSLHLYTAKPLVIMLGFPLIVLSTVYHPLSWTSRLLELSLLKFIGRISYSLYLWQQLFFLADHQGAARPLSLLQQAPWSYLAAFALALASYHFVERPFIRIGHKVACR